MREYERSTFALLNAYTSKALAGVDELVERLQNRGLRNPPLLIHSGGGSISVKEGRRTPAVLAESGPAAGVVGALAICEAAGVHEAVACDMGGTSFDMSIIRNGDAVRRSRGDLMGIWTALPMMDIESVTAGGGSIGWIDPIGLPRVGPLSAGAQPGPACYGRGGTIPTVTDALLLLGYIEPSRFLGGSMKLDFNAAALACKSIGQTIGEDVYRIAWGIYEVARSVMVRALRAQFAQKGLDPRDFALISMGGCCGLFSSHIAQDLGMRRVLVPQLTSVLSAFGAAIADVRRERSRSLAIMLPADAQQLQQTAEDLASMVEADLIADGVAELDRQIDFELDLRFFRQQWELTVCAAEGFGKVAQAALITQFKDEYSRRYGKGAILFGAPVELVTIRAVGKGTTLGAVLSRAELLPECPAEAAGYRTIYIDKGGEMTAAAVPVFDGDLIRPGHFIDGPALIDASDTTIWLPQGTHARFDVRSTLDIEVTP
jgi:N-methylhydantoinase A